MPQKISRQAALKAKKKFYFTGKKCENGHIDKRYTSNNRCFKCSKQTLKQWLKDNKEAALDHYQNRKKQIKKATPEWADKDKLKELYDKAEKAGKTVDHIIPLQHDKVCGLHIPENLVIADKSDNKSKHNNFEPKWEKR